MDDLQEIFSVFKKFFFSIPQKTLDCFELGGMLAQNTFISCGGNVYLDPESISETPLWIKRIFYVTSVLSAPLHLGAAIFGFFYGVVDFIIWPAISTTLAVIFGIGRALLDRVGQFFSYIGGYLQMVYQYLRNSTQRVREYFGELGHQISTMLFSTHKPELVPAAPIELDLESVIASKKPLTPKASTLSPNISAMPSHDILRKEHNNEAEPVAILDSRQRTRTNSNAKRRPDPKSLQQTINGQVNVDGCIRTRSASDLDN